MAKELRITMPDGSIWAVPVLAIAMHRAEAYKSEFGHDLQRSLHEDTLPLFESAPYEIEDWAANNMNWDEVESQARCVQVSDDVDYQEGWCNGEKEVVEATDDE